MRGTPHATKATPHQQGQQEALTPDTPMSHGYRTCALHARPRVLNEERLQAAGLGLKLSAAGRLQAAVRRIVRACRLSAGKKTVNKGTRDVISKTNVPEQRCVPVFAPACMGVPNSSRTSSSPTKSSKLRRRIAKSASPIMVTQVPNRGSVILWQEIFLPLPHAPVSPGDLLSQQPVVDYRIFESDFRGPAGEVDAEDSAPLSPCAYM